MEQESPLYKSRGDLMTIFWDPEDQRWCDECDEYLQQYHSLALLQDEQVIPDEKLRSGYEKSVAFLFCFSYLLLLSFLLALLVI
ncbi:DUF1033 family protein [Stenotrophomonas acidaminiphila]|nr:DUF1033 family protein [Stenotrophomonas acidaminiphila]